MKLVLQEFLTLDGVSQGPGSPDEDTSDGFTQGGWFVPYLDEPFLQTINAWISEADAFLFGRHTYENFARDWRPERPGRQPAERAAEVRRLPQPGRDRLGTDHHPLRRRPGPGRSLEAATGPRSADPRQRPPWSVAARRQPDRRVAAGDRPGRPRPRPETVPAGRHPDG